MITIALASGAVSGAILLFLSHLAPYFKAGNFIRDLDHPRVFNKEISRRESHYLGIFSHLAISTFFGGAYAFLNVLGLVTGFDILPLLGWSLIMSLFLGGVVLPLEGHGLFGVKEDAWFPVDLILTNAAWALIFWWIVNLWPPAMLS